MNHPLSKVSTSFQELLTNELNIHRFTKNGIHDIPFAILSFIRILSGFVRTLEAENDRNMQEELMQIIERLKTVIKKVSAMSSEIIIKMEEKKANMYSAFVTGEDDELEKTCADKFNETYENGLKEIREADGAWETAKEIIDWGGDYIDATKWCVDKLFDKVDKFD